MPATGARQTRDRRRARPAPPVATPGTAVDKLWNTCARPRRSRRDRPTCGAGVVDGDGVGSDDTRDHSRFDSTADPPAAYFPGAMRIRTLVPALILVAACGNAAEEGRKAAQREAAALRKEEESKIKPVDRVKVTVPQGTRLKCEQVMDPNAYTAALEELDPLTVRDGTGAMIDSTVSCTLVRGGVRPNPKEQEKLIKKYGRLGVLPGDVLCSVSLYCWVADDAETYRNRCKPSPTTAAYPDEGTTGGFACRSVHPTGEFDIDSFKFYDTDTRCVIEVRGGPSMTDNDKIAACARTARESIGPEHVKVDAPARYEVAPPAEPPVTP